MALINMVKWCSSAIPSNDTLPRPHARCDGGDRLERQRHFQRAVVRHHRSHLYRDPVH
jgi:hypothetical protein